VELMLAVGRGVALGLPPVIGLAVGLAVVFGLAVGVAVVGLDVELGDTSKSGVGIGEARMIGVVVTPGGGIRLNVSESDEAGEASGVSIGSGVALASGRAVGVGEGLAVGVGLNFGFALALGLGDSAGAAGDLD
jgi:hypothetical protein